MSHYGCSGAFQRKHLSSLKTDQYNDELLLLDTFPLVKQVQRGTSF